MLLLGTETEVAGAVLYRDHVAPNVFHHLPGPPRIVVGEQGPAVRLVRYRGEGTGALLTLEVELGLDDAVLAAVRAELATRTGVEPTLVPVTFHEGVVRLVALGTRGPAAGDTSPSASGTSTGADPAPTEADVPGAATPEHPGDSRLADTPPPDAPPADAQPVGSSTESELVERILGVATPSLFGHGRALFSVLLDAEGAVLVGAALRSGDLPVVVAYDLAFQGLRPSRGVRARVEATMAYDYLRTRASVDALWVRADIDREAESLARSGAIQIEDVDYLGVDPATLQSRAAEIRATLTELTESLFFRSAASAASVAASAPESPVAQAWAARGAVRAAFVLRQLSQEEHQSLAYDLTETAVATARVAPQGALRLPAGTDPAAVIAEVTADWPPQAVEVRVSAAEGDWSGVAAIEVDVRSGTGAPVTFVLGPDRPEGSALLPSSDLSHRIRVLRTDDPEALGVPPPDDPEFRPLPTFAVTLDPRAVSGRRMVRVALGMVDPSVLRQVEGRLEVGEDARAFLLEPSGEDATFPVFRDAPATIRADLVMADGATHPLTVSVEPSQTVAVLNQPPDLFRTVAIELRDPLARLASVAVELDSGPGGRRGLATLDEGSPSSAWTYSRPSDPATPYRYRVQSVGRHGEVSAGEWVEGRGSLLVVGDTEVRVDPIDVVLVGWPEGAAGALVTLTSLAPPPGVPPTVEAVVEPDGPLFTARVPFAAGAPRRYGVGGQVFIGQEVRDLPVTEAVGEVLVLRLS
jgi:hypothetical protein